MQKGHIGVTTENIFPIIKKFLYSDHEIFLREIISNATDATRKLQTYASKGEFAGELGNLTIRVKIDKEAGTLTISDRGVGMTKEEVEKYINQIAFSSAGEFLDKYKTDANAIIGHFGLGFYSSFMVSKQVDVITKSFKDGEQAMKWSCDGSPEYTIEEAEKTERGTDIVMHLDDDSKEFLEDSKIHSLLRKYCKFLPIEIAFGTEKEWKDGKEVETGKDKIINETNPLWTRTPAELTDEDYRKFYIDLYPTNEDALFNIHLNVDYPFNLTGVLYFPKFKNNLEIQKNKIQLYCNQVFVTDQVEGIVPEYLTLLHGVLDSPDIPLNVSRSYLQSDSNVKKISSHITKKVADRLNDIFKNDREQLEKKWDDLKLFIAYGMLSDEKFEERARKFYLLKNTESKYFTIEEYENLVKENQTNNDSKVVLLYTHDAVEQHSFVERAQAKGYDVLLMNGQLDAHFINQMEQKNANLSFTRVDSDVAEKLIKKDDAFEAKLTAEQEKNLTPVFESQVPKNGHFHVSFEALSENDNPVIITQSEFMRRMKDMAKMGGGQMSFYGEMPDSYNLVVNSNHSLVTRLLSEQETATKGKLSEVDAEIAKFEADREALEALKKDKKDDEVAQEEKDKMKETDAKIADLEKKRDEVLKTFGTENNLVKQLIDLALLANGMLKGEALTKFVKRSVSLIE
ncbi:MAG TPA: molecular chaperone HtpG [Bacteroidales bacterium]|nr:molecular chaperone HtpG [Bacteroidales bacterium]